MSIMRLIFTTFQQIGIFAEFDKAFPIYRSTCLIRTTIFKFFLAPVRNILFFKESAQLGQYVHYKIIIWYL